ncbi:MAG: hypothetical protein ABL958_02520, partial [Bdellovibrionia bacterium]
VGDHRAGDPQHDRPADRCLGRDQACGDRTAAFLGALVYMSSFNMLLLQSMAMMEPLFNLTIIGSIYA